MVMAAGAVYMFAPDWGHSADRFATWGVGAALIVLGAVWMEPWTVRAPLTSRLSFLGDASYSIYLSHTFVVPAGVQALKRLGVQDSLAIALAVGLALALFGWWWNYEQAARPLALWGPEHALRIRDAPRVAVAAVGEDLEDVLCLFRRDLAALVAEALAHRHPERGRVDELYLAATRRRLAVGQRLAAQRSGRTHEVVHAPRQLALLEREGDAHLPVRFDAWRPEHVVQVDRGEGYRLHRVVVRGPDRRLRSRPGPP